MSISIALCVFFVFFLFKMGGGWSAFFNFEIAKIRNILQIEKKVLDPSIRNILTYEYAKFQADLLFNIW